MLGGEVMHKKALALALLALACTKDQDTVITVEVSTDYQIPTTLDTIRLLVTGNEERSQDFALGLGGGATHPASDADPLRVSLVPQAAKDQAFTVRATGLQASQTKVAQEAKVSFLPGEKHTLRLFLRTDCDGEFCTAMPNQTCDHMKCIPTTDIPLTRPPLDAAVRDSGAERKDSAPKDLSPDGPFKCSLTNSTGCAPPNSKCTYLCGSSSYVCIPPGSKSLYEVCGGQGECPTNSGCGEISRNRFICLPLCFTNSDCPSDLCRTDLPLKCPNGTLVAYLCNPL